MSPAKTRLAIWEKQQRSDGCSLLQNYRIGGKIPSAALNLSWLCAILTYLSGESLQRLLVNTTILPRKPQKLHMLLSLRNFCSWIEKSVIHSALPLVPISAPHAERWGQIKKNERICFHMEILSKIQLHWAMSAKMVLNMMLSLLHPLSSAQLSLRFQLGISHVSRACTAPWPPAAL